MQYRAVILGEHPMGNHGNLFRNVPFHLPVLPKKRLPRASLPLGRQWRALCRPSSGHTAAAELSKNQLFNSRPLQLHFSLQMKYYHPPLLFFNCPQLHMAFFSTLLGLSPGWQFITVNACFKEMGCQIHNLPFLATRQKNKIKYI